MRRPPLQAVCLAAGAAARFRGPAVFAVHDAISLPVAGVDGVIRPGPGLRIYRLP